MNKFIVYILSFLIGAAILCFFATLQKMSMGVPLVLRGYVVPFLFGGIAGALVGIWRNKIKEAYENLENTVKDRTNELSESEYYLKKAQGITHIGHWRLDPKTGQIEGSDELLRIFGLTKEQSTLNAFVEVVHPEDREFDVTTIQNGIETGEHWSIEHRLLMKDGTVKWVNAIGEPVLDEQKKVIHIIGTVQDITKNKESESLLKQILADKDVLMREVHHRTKNNLTVIQSLLSLQSSHVSDMQTKGLFDESKNRVRAMSMIHERLYKSSDLSTIDVSEYLNSLISDIFNNYHLNSAKVDLQLNLPKIHLDVDKIIPCGLITNELVSNALKYAFPENSVGTIYVGIEADKITGNAMLIVRDNGIGLPDDFDIKSTRSLGMQIVSSLSNQIGREVEIVRDNGTEYRILLKEVELKPFEWDDEAYGSSIAEIDKHHKGLINLLNQIKSDIESGRQDEIIRELIPKLVDYTVIHFKTEEKYMLQYEYPDTAAHKAEHEKFIKEVSATIAAIKEGKVVLSYEVHEFLANWVEKHVAEVDKQLLDYLNAKMDESA